MAQLHTPALGIGLDVTSIGGMLTLERFFEALCQSLEASECGRKVYCVLGHEKTEEFGQVVKNLTSLRCALLDQFLTRK